ADCHVRGRNQSSLKPPFPCYGKSVGFRFKVTGTWGGATKAHSPKLDFDKLCSDQFYPMVMGLGIGFCSLDLCARLHSVKNGQSICRLLFLRVEPFVKLIWTLPT